MQQVYINQLSNHVGEEVTLRGWLFNMRSSGKLMFPQLRDGTGFVPLADSVVEAGDEVLLVLDPGLEEDLTAQFSSDGQPG